VSQSEVDPTMYQQPPYNPFEMKYRNVNEFPLTEAVNKENIISHFSNVKRRENIRRSRYYNFSTPSEYLKMNSTEMHITILPYEAHWLQTSLIIHNWD
jgi:hypothetical protein